MMTFVSKFAAIVGVLIGVFIVLTICALAVVGTLYLFGEQDEPNNNINNDNKNE